MSVENYKDSIDKDKEFLPIPVLINNTKAVQNALIAIGNDYKNVQRKSSLQSKESEAEHILYKLSIIDKSLEKVDLAYEETVILLSLTKYLEDVQVDKMRMRLQVKRLQEENAWLQSELEMLQTKNSKLDYDISKALSEKQHFQFLYDMRKYEIKSETMKNELFDRDKEEDIEDEADKEIPPRLRVLHNLVKQYASQGRYEVALPLCKQAYNDLKKTSGEFHIDVATMACIYANVHKDQHNFKEAYTLYEEALKIREALHGKNHQSVGTVLSNIAIILIKRGKFKEAEPICRRALNIKLNTLGRKHPEVAKQMNNIALLCQNMEKYADVERFYKEAIDIYERRQEEIPLTKTKLNLVTYYMKTQNYDEAEYLSKSILLAKHIKLYGEPDGINKTIYSVIEENAKIKTIKSVRDILMAKFGKVKDDMLIAALKNLSHVYKKQKKEIFALVIDEWLIESARKLSSPNSEISECRSMSECSSAAAQNLPKKSIDQVKHQSKSSTNRKSTKFKNIFRTKSKDDGKRK